MAASDHINPMIKVYHMSWKDTPPHEQAPTNLQGFTEDGNTHPDVLHMGTRDAAMSIYRHYLHEYEIDPRHVDTVVHGDSQSELDNLASLDEEMSDPNTYHPPIDSWKIDQLRGTQQGLWESLPGDPRQAIKENKVLPYRNLAEDVGSISYMVPKSAIKAGYVRHVGVQNAIELRKKEQGNGGL